MVFCPRRVGHPLLVGQRVRTLAYQGSPELRAPDCGLLGSTWEASAPRPQVSAIAARPTMPDIGTPDQPVQHGDLAAVVA